MTFATNFVRVINGSIPMNTRRTLMAAVNSGQLERLPKKGDFPEVFYHKDAEAQAIAAHKRALGEMKWKPGQRSDDVEDRRGEKPNAARDRRRTRVSKPGGSAKRMGRRLNPGLWDEAQSFSTYRTMVSRVVESLQLEASVTGLTGAKVAFKVGPSGKYATAEVTLRPGVDNKDALHDMAYNDLAKVVFGTDMYTPFSGQVPGEGKARDGRIDKPDSVVLVVTTDDDQYDEIYEPDVKAWASAMRSLGYKTVGW